MQSAFPALLAPGAKAWDVALAEITITQARARNINFSVPYMRVDQGIMVSQYLRSEPRRVADLRKLRLCAQTGTTGADVIDAVVYDLPALATLKARAPQRYGDVVGLIRTRERYGAALPKGSALAGPVNAALTAMRQDGTISRLAKPWLELNLSGVRTFPTGS